MIKVCTPLKHGHQIALKNFSKRIIIMGKYGFSFSWKRTVGNTGAKQSFAEILESQQPDKDLRES